MDQNPRPGANPAIPGRDAVPRGERGRHEASDHIPGIRKSAIGKQPVTDRLHDASAYDYVLPEERIARTPAERREDAKLLVVGPAGELRDLTFAAFPTLLRAGDVLVLNETRVIPARLRFARASGGAGEVLLAAAGRPRRLRVRRAQLVRARPAGAALAARDAHRDRRLRARRSKRWPRTAGGSLRFDPEVDIAELLERAGELPLPPYVGAGDASRAARYQTVFARVPGSVAAPTASLHFTDGVLAAVAAAGVDIVRLTLDVGLGTFRPMRPGPIAAHRMHAERYAIPEAAAAAINRAVAEGRRIVAAGTTVVRALEAAAPGGRDDPRRERRRPTCSSRRGSASGLSTRC